MKTLFAALAMALALSACATQTRRPPPRRRSRSPRPGFPARPPVDPFAMAGDHRVTFRLQETAAFVADYEPIKRGGGGYEIVRVIEDTNTKNLQHILVMGWTTARPSSSSTGGRTGSTNPPASLRAGKGRWT